MVLVAALWPRTAHACGGFFCQSAPVVQSGEQIVYVVADDGALTMSVRINYQGAAPEFAWILPVPETPRLSLGTTALFDALDRTTRPTFQIIDGGVEGTCRPYPRCEFPPPPDTGDSGTFFWIQDASAPSADAGPSGPTIYAQSSLGPFETVVLGGGSATEIHEWLVANGYDLSASSIPLLDAYVTMGQRFVALRLRNDATVQEIQPFSLGCGVQPPCLPIRLTAIATQPDLPITAFFLARTRATARNYSSLETPFPGTLWTGAVTYEQWVSNEAHDLGGQAFITDFAGPTPSLALELPAIDDLATASRPQDIVSALISRGYANDSLLTGLLFRFIEPPEGELATNYLNCLARFGSCGEPASFDPAGLVAAVEESIREPRALAQGWVEDRPYLSRLFTTMSAEEMTVDPEFVLDEGLGDASNIHVARTVTECDPTRYLEDAAQRLDLPSGESFELRRRRVSWSEAEYCARVGGWLAGTDASIAGVDAAVPPGIDGGVGPSTIGGGGGCSAVLGAGSRVELATIGLVLGLVLARRRR